MLTRMGSRRTENSQLAPAHFDRNNISAISGTGHYANDMLITAPRAHEPWPAELHLRFARRQARTVLVERRHSGPLTVQKALYPEGEQICHAVIVHPPGGIAGGDELLFEIDLEANSSAVVTTPAATKWYKAPLQQCRQQVRIRLAQGATLDWLPQENIFFNATRVESTFTLQIDAGATAMGWEIAVLGRQASAEQWAEGSLRCLTSIQRTDGLPLWFERLALDACDFVPKGAPGALRLQRFRHALGGRPGLHGRVCGGARFQSAIQNRIASGSNLPSRRDTADTGSSGHRRAIAPDDGRLLAASPAASTRSAIPPVASMGNVNSSTPLKSPCWPDWAGGESLAAPRGVSDASRRCKRRSGVWTFQGDFRALREVSPRRSARRNPKKSTRLSVRLRNLVE